MNAYDTLSRTIKPLSTNDPFRMYSCGVTVYDHPHIGHARSYIVWDVLKRWLKTTRNVIHVQNFTDIDDKIINKSIQEQTTAKAVADKYIQSYHEDMLWLNVQPADLYPKVSHYTNQMERAAHQLLRDNHAYKDNDDIRFNSKNYHNYGQLSRKTEAEDFVLWKGPKDHETEFPHGRPGWHLECSVIIEQTLGNDIELHTGGNDLIFPHHDNEIAQSECLHDQPLAQHWMHNGMVVINDQKMGKSNNNANTIKSFKENTDPNTIRYWILQASYAKPLSTEFLNNSQHQWETLRQRLESAPPTGISPKFKEALDNDLNTPQALAELLINPTTEMADILGFKIHEETIPEEIEALAALRNIYRKQQKWKEADTLKQEIIKEGYQLQDGPQTTKVTKG